MPRSRWYTFSTTHRHSNSTGLPALPSTSHGVVPEGALAPGKPRMKKLFWEKGARTRNWCPSLICGNWLARAIPSWARASRTRVAAN
jgi:hypothetical protein